MRNSESVLITLERSCDFTIPTISSDSSYGDTMTYVRFSTAVTLSFSSYSASCNVQSSVTNISGASLPSFFSFTSGVSSGTDQLKFSTNLPTNEGIHNLKYILKSTEAPELYRELAFDVQVLMSTCNKSWRFPSDP